MKYIIIYKSRFSAGKKIKKVFASKQDFHDWQCWFDYKNIAYTIEIM